MIRFSCHVFVRFRYFENIRFLSNNRGKAYKNNLEEYLPKIQIHFQVENLEVHYRNHYLCRQTNVFLFVFFYLRTSYHVSVHTRVKVCPSLKHEYVDFAFELFDVPPQTLEVLEWSVQSLILNYLYLSENDF